MSQLEQKFLYNILIDCCSTHEDRQNKACLINTYSEWSVTGDASLSLFFNFALGYISKKIQINEEGLKLNGIYQISVYTYDINLVGENMHTINKTQKPY
jgi:hypothetical protein